MLTRNFATSLGSDSQKIGAVEERLLDARPARRVDDDDAEQRRRRRPSRRPRSAAIAPPSARQPETGPVASGAAAPPDRLGQGPVGIHGLAVANGQGWKTGALAVGRHLLGGDRARARP